MFSVVVYACDGFSVVSRRFSVVLVDSQWFSVVLPVGSQWFLVVLSVLKARVLLKNIFCKYLHDTST